MNSITKLRVELKRELRKQGIDARVFGCRNITMIEGKYGQDYEKLSEKNIGNRVGDQYLGKIIESLRKWGHY